MTAEQLVVLALLIAAFAAGWIARDPPRPRRARRQDDQDDDGVPPEAAAVAAAAVPVADAGVLAPPVVLPVEPAPPSPSAPPDPAALALRTLDAAAEALTEAVERWLDERDAIGDAGRAALDDLRLAVRRLRAVTAVLQRGASPARWASEAGLAALEDALAELEAFREGRRLDAPTARALDEDEQEIERARARLRDAVEG